MADQLSNNDISRLAKAIVEAQNKGRRESTYTAPPVRVLKEEKELEEQDIDAIQNDIRAKYLKQLKDQYLKKIAQNQKEIEELEEKRNSERLSQKKLSEINEQIRARENEILQLRDETKKSLEEINKNLEKEKENLENKALSTVFENISKRSKKTFDDFLNNVDKSLENFQVAGAAVEKYKDVLEKEISDLEQDQEKRQKLGITSGDLLKIRQAKEKEYLKTLQQSINDESINSQVREDLQKLYIEEKVRLKQTTFGAEARGIGGVREGTANLKDIARDFFERQASGKFKDSSFTSKEGLKSKAGNILSDALRPFFGSDARKIEEEVAIQKPLVPGIEPKQTKKITLEDISNELNALREESNIKPVEEVLESEGKPAKKKKSTKKAEELPEGSSEDFNQLKDSIKQLISAVKNSANSKTIKSIDNTLKEILKTNNELVNYSKLSEKSVEKNNVEKTVPEIVEKNNVEKTVPENVAEATDLNPSKSEETLLNIKKILEEATENVPLRISIADVDKDASEKISNAFCECISNTLIPFMQKEIADKLLESNEKILKALKGEGTSKPEERAEPEEEDSIIDDLLDSKTGKRKGTFGRKAKALAKKTGRKVAQKSRLLGRGAMQLGRTGVQAATSGLGVGGLINAPAGAALSGSLGTGAAVTAGGLVLGTAAAGLYAGYKAEEKLGLGTKAIEAVGVNKTANQKEKNNEELNEKLKQASAESDPLQKKIKFFEAQKENLEKEIKITKGEEQEQAKKRLERVEKSLEKLKLEKETGSDAVKAKYEQAGLTEAPEVTLPPGASAKEVESMYEKAGMLKAPDVTPGSKPVSSPEPAPSSPAALAKKAEVEKTKEKVTPVQPSKDGKVKMSPRSFQDDFGGLSDEEVAANKAKEEEERKKRASMPVEKEKEIPVTKVSAPEYKKFTTTEAMTFEGMSQDEAAKAAFKKLSEGHPYNPDNPEFKKNPKLWEALKGNKPQFSSFAEGRGDTISGSYSIMGQPNFDKIKGYGLDTELFAAGNSTKTDPTQAGLDRKFMQGAVEAAKSGVGLKTDLGTYAELIRGSKIQEVQKLMAKEDPELLKYVPKDFHPGAKTKILSPDVKKDVLRGLETLGKTDVEGIGGADVKGIARALGEGDYETVVQAMEYMGKTQKRDTLPIKKETYEALTGKPMSKEMAKKYEEKEIKEKESLAPKPPEASKEPTVEKPGEMPKLPGSAKADGEKLAPQLDTNNNLTAQTNELLSQLIGVVANKEMGGNNITPIIPPAAPPQNKSSLQQKSPAYEFRSQNRYSV